MSQVAEFFTVSPARKDHVPAARIALSVAVPLLLLLALDRTDLAIYAAFGAFTAIYARHEPARDRFRHQVQAGIMLTGCVSLGALLSTLHAPNPVTLAVTSVVAGLGALAAALFTLKPAGSVFFIFAVGAVGSLPEAAPVWLAASIAAASATLSVLLGLAGRWVGEGVRGPVTPVPTHHGLSPWQLWSHAGRFFLATALAAVAGSLVGGSHSYWAMVAAAAPIAAPNLTARVQRGVHRMVGTLGGIGVTAFLLSLQLQEWHIVVFVIVLQFLAEMYIGRNYSLALLFITPLALLMTQLSHFTNPAELLQARAVETVVGSVCGLMIVYLFRSRAERVADTQAMPLIARGDLHS